MKHSGDFIESLVDTVIYYYYCYYCLKRTIGINNLFTAELLSLLLHSKMLLFFSA